jgi:hypothetical protein
MAIPAEVAFKQHDSPAFSPGTADSSRTQDVWERSFLQADHADMRPAQSSPGVFDAELLGQALLP